MGPPGEGGLSEEWHSLLQKRLLTPGTAPLPPSDTGSMVPVGSRVPGRRVSPHGAQVAESQQAHTPAHPHVSAASCAPWWQWGLASPEDLGLYVLALSPGSDVGRSTVKC